jgi:PAS domain S-box-containing protein
MPVDQKYIRSLRQKAEKALAEAPEKLALMSGSHLQRLVHELSVRQIELEMQSEELRLSREQLEQSRGEYADLYDFAPVGYLTFDKTGLVTRANLTACGLLGVERSLLVKQPFVLFVHPESRDLFYFHVRKVVETTTAQACQLVLKRKDGTLFDAHLESVAAQVDGQPVINAILTDITERKRTEDALRRQAALLDLSPDAIMVCDMDGTITLWGHGAEMLYGWTGDEARGQLAHALLKTRFPEPREQIDRQARSPGSGRAN